MLSLRLMRPLLYTLLLLGFAVPGMGQKCNTTLWKHVYHGTFPTAHDRLKQLKACVTVTGTIESANPELDGDYHIRLRVDPQFHKLLNSKNITEQKGFLVVEPMCAHPVTQEDVLAEAVCNNFHQRLFKASMRQKRV